MSWSPFRAALAGACGAVANALAIRLTTALDLDAGTSGFAKWLFSHMNDWFGLTLPLRLGPVSQELFHTGIGIVSALIFAAIFYRLLPGPRWLRGLVYCQGMWVVQALVVLPCLGHGYFGSRISLSTPIWSWLLNAIYGIVLGALYRPSAVIVIHRDVGDVVPRTRSR